jgi:hypothetical protein
MKNAFSLRGFAAAAALVALATFASTGVNAQETTKVAKAVPVAKAAPIAKAVPSLQVRPLSVMVTLLSKTKLTGTLTDITSINMRTSFGAADIPLSEVAGVRFASADDASTTIVMLNGDSITGATDINLMTVETEWGIAAINGSNVASVLLVPGIAWQPQVGLNGNRWNLATVKKPAPPAAAKPTTASRTASSTQRRSPMTSSRTVYSRGR